MMDYVASYNVITKFYLDCVRFWKKQGYQWCDAHDMAGKDVEALTTNPYDPNGKELDPRAKEDFLK